MRAVLQSEFEPVQAAMQDRFQEVPAAAAKAEAAQARSPRLRVLLLADTGSRLSVVKDHIDAIRRYSRHDIVVLNPIELQLGWTMRWGDFDAIVIHYSIAVLFDYYLPPAVRELVRAFPGPRIQIIQDECRWVDRMTRTMADLGIGAVFSSLTLDNLPRVYHHPHLQEVRFYSSLPGYVTERYLRLKTLPISERPFHFVYRGQRLLPQYGKGAKEKLLIGEQGAELARKFGLRADIKTREEDRIFGEDWLKHLTSGKAVLGTEGGVSVFDFDESVERGVADYMQANPSASWDEVWEKVVQPYEGNVVHRTITPRVFEAIMCRTALVMYPGEFRGLLTPWEHYIPLARDGSNEVKVAGLLRDDGYLQAMADRAHVRVANDPQLQFPVYAAAIDAALDELESERSSPRRNGLTHNAKGLLPAVRKLELQAIKWRAWLDYRWNVEIDRMRILREKRDEIPQRLLEMLGGGRILGAAGRASNGTVSAEARNILIVTDFWSTRIGTVRDHLDAFRKFSRNRICIVDSRTCDRKRPDLEQFDVILLHYSIVISGYNYISNAFADRLRAFQGYKALFIQDEYRWVDRTAAAIADFGIDVIYSVINEGARDRVYHHGSTRHVRRKTTLTGFVPIELTRLEVPSYEQRAIDIGYRARRLRASLGALGQEKWRIGERVAADAERHGLVTDIAHEESKRIYGKKWISFVMNCKAVLGTESGASFIDFDGTVLPETDAYEDAHPHEPVESIQKKFLGARDGEIVISVISPRCFEAAALRTLMILYPGDYSSILVPWRHYVPLAKDHSNMDEVVAVLRNPRRAKEIIDNAYREIALNPKYSFESMVTDFDRDIAQNAKRHAGNNSSEKAVQSRLRMIERSSALRFFLRDLVLLRCKRGLYVAVDKTMDLVVPETLKPEVWRRLRATAERLGLLQRL